MQQNYQLNGHSVITAALLVCAALLAVLMLPNQAHAADTVYSGRCGEDAYWTYDSDGVLSITGTGAVVKKGYNNSYQAPSNFTVRDSGTGSGYLYMQHLATAITVGEGITSIEDSLFKNYMLVESVTLPSTLAAVDDQTFYGCRKISKVAFTGAPTLKTISTMAFYDCRGITSFTIPASVTAIEDEAFEDCVKLAKVAAAKGSLLASIGEGAFRNCSALKSVSCGSARLASIGAGAFAGCKALKSVSLPAAKSFSKMGAGAFEPGTFSAKVTKAAAKKKRRLAVGWAKVAGATGYRLYYKAKSAKKFKSVSLAGTSKTLKKLKRGKRYKVYVEAYLGKVLLAKSAVKTSGKVKK